MRTASAVFLISSLIVHSAVAEELGEKPKYPEIKQGTVGVEYHTFTLLRYQRTIIALHILPDPIMGSDGIAYRWFHLTDGTDIFFRPAPKGNRSSFLPNSAVKSGAGETYEGEFYLGSGQIKVGPLKVEWSKGGLNSGWLYLSKAGNGIEVYSQQFERLEDASGKLDEANWKPISGADKP
jgi:hypothetical protein